MRRHVTITSDQREFERERRRARRARKFGRTIVR